jgi:hypothetical protein
MILNLITLATVKTQLGISDTTYDASITAMIPIVSNDVRRILNCNFDDYTQTTITSGSAEIELSENSFNYNEPSSRFMMGQVIYSPGVPADTYIQSFDPDTSIYTLSTSATAAGTYFYPTVMISQWPAISKMIFYKISKQTTGAATERLYNSIAYGNVRKDFADGEVNKKYDYPQTLINDLGTPFARVG